MCRKGPIGRFSQERVNPLDGKLCQGGASPSRADVGSELARDPVAVRTYLANSLAACPPQTRRTKIRSQESPASRLPTPHPSHVIEPITLLRRAVGSSRR